MNSCGACHAPSVPGGRYCANCGQTVNELATMAFRTVEESRTLPVAGVRFIAEPAQAARRTDGAPTDMRSPVGQPWPPADTASSRPGSRRRVSWIALALAFLLAGGGVTTWLLLRSGSEPMGRTFPVLALEYSTAPTTSTKIDVSAISDGTVDNLQITESNSSVLIANSSQVVMSSALLNQQSHLGEMSVAAFDSSTGAVRWVVRRQTLDPSGAADLDTFRCVPTADLSRLICATGDGPAAGAAGAVQLTSIDVETGAASGGSVHAVIPSLLFPIDDDVVLPVGDGGVFHAARFDPTTGARAWIARAGGAEAQAPHWVDDLLDLPMSTDASQDSALLNPNDGSVVRILPSVINGSRTTGWYGTRNGLGGVGTSRFDSNGSALWTINGARLLDVPQVEGGALLATLNDRLVRLDTADGHARWTAQGSPDNNAAVFMNCDDRLVVSDGRTTRLINATDGTELLRTKQRVAGAALSTLYLASQTDLAAYDLNSGDRIWQVALNSIDPTFDTSLPFVGTAPGGYLVVQGGDLLLLRPS